MAPDPDPRRRRRRGSTRRCILKHERSGLTYKQARRACRVGRRYRRRRY